jgi:hypothetical protein
MNLLNLINLVVVLTLHVFLEMLTSQEIYSIAVDTEMEYDVIIALACCHIQYALATSIYKVLNECKLCFLMCIGNDYCLCFTDSCRRLCLQTTMINTADYES